MGNHLLIGILGYTDDVTFISKTTTTMSERVTKLTRGAKTDTDMVIDITKSKTLQVVKQAKVDQSTETEMAKTEATYKHVCSFCPRYFKTVLGLKIFTPLPVTANTDLRIKPSK